MGKRKQATRRKQSAAQVNVVEAPAVADPLAGLSEIDAFGVVCLEAAAITQELEWIPASFETMPQIVENNFRRLVWMLNFFCHEYLSRRGPWLSKLQAVHAPNIVRLGAFTGTCYSELGFSVARSAYLYLATREITATPSPHAFNEKLRAYLDGGSKGAPPALNGDDVWKWWSADAKMNQLLFPSDLRLPSLPTYNELADCIRQEIALIKATFSQGENRIVVQLEPPQVTLDGTAHAVKPDGAMMVKSLVDADGDWLSGADIGLGRADRARNGLPDPIRNLIEASAAKGFRIRRSSSA